MVPGNLDGYLGTQSPRCNYCEVENAARIGCWTKTDVANLCFAVHRTPANSALFFVFGHVILQPIGSWLGSGADAGDIGIFITGTWSHVCLSLLGFRTTCLFFFLAFDLSFFSRAFLCCWP